MSRLADRFPTMAKHWATFRESWRNQNEADAAFRPKEEHEFLPAALEIMEKPPSPGMRWLLLLTCVLFVLALLWAIFGRIDVVAVASGKTVPDGSVKIVQPLDFGSVRAIHVRNGQFVRAGDLLIELDPTVASAEEAQSEQGLLSAQILQARNNAMLAHLQGRDARFVAPPGTPGDVIATEQALVDSAIAQFEAESASLMQQSEEQSAALEGAEAEVAKLQEALPFIEQQLSARSELAEQGFYSRLELLEYEQLRAEHIRNIDIQNANARAARAAMGRIDAEMRRLRSTFGRTAVTDLAEASENAALSGEQLRAAERRRELQDLRAPVDGVVQQLAVSTVGGVVQPAQQLMVIVPCSSGDASVAAACNAGISVEAYVQNKDIGFVSVGQRVAVKLEAFNFTDYGLIEGTVTDISRDAIDQSDAPVGSERDENGRPVQGGLVYAARISLDCGPEIDVRHSLCDRVQPGMSVQAEIKTGTRRIIQYLLSPISQTLDEAGRER
ncbi:HlyD family type I secretion periplasmic adaptor subunit [Aurantiacibacter sp. MUD61]|uniref:HlyD family type I secretion periplasmic adaptor subunit n=1 Tax=Aurantiacibacter sp. MUD61 TaxID=3009083 RepID=UPI0022F010E3|nr:HlyD family type I secretion periplasmic adaptor subunit [Aurantiacibacter sp. MUD61]